MRASLPPASPMLHDGPRPNWHALRQLGPLGLVILLHAAFFYALQSGLHQQAKQAEPRAIIATLIAAQPAPPAQAPAPQALAPQPPPPKPQPVPKPRKPVVAPKPAPQPAPKAITTPAEPSPAPAPAEPATAPAPANAAPSTAPGSPAAPSSAPAQPRTVTSGVEYLQPPRPEYPALSRRMGEEGTVMLRILITERGRTERVDIHKTSGVPRLDEAARQAALRAVFKPYTENGRPVPVYAILPISFQLDN